MSFPVPGRVAELLRRSTVQIRTGQGRLQGNGSGIILNNGRLITNAHVLPNGEPLVETWEGETVRAVVSKKDRVRDLAVLKVEKLQAPAATLASGSVRAGDMVIAVGNPFGFVGAVSTGVVQRVGPIRGLGLAKWVQSDLRLAPGNSGGPLANIHGEIIGVNTMIAGPLAMAIPVDAVQLFLTAKAPERSLGVTVRPVRVARKDQARRLGLMILELERDGNAERASLLPGDILVSAQGRELASPDDLALALTGGETLTVGFLRGAGGEERRVTVQLAPARVVNAA